MSILREGWGGVADKEKDGGKKAIGIDTVVRAAPGGSESAFPFDDDGKFAPGGSGAGPTL